MVPRFLVPRFGSQTSQKKGLQGEVCCEDTQELEEKLRTWWEQTGELAVPTGAGPLTGAAFRTLRAWD